MTLPTASFFWGLPDPLPIIPGYGLVASSSDWLRATTVSSGMGRNEFLVAGTATDWHLFPVLHNDPDGTVIDETRPLIIPKDPPHES